MWHATMIVIFMKKQVVGGVSIGRFNHCEEVLLSVPIELKTLPTFLAERTCEEKMECGFLMVARAEDAVIIVALYLELLSY
jgi:hypothetical protein